MSANYRQQMRPMPVDFLEVAAGQATTWLRKHYGTSTQAIARWRVECGLSAPTGYRHGNGYRPIPEDFAEIAPTKTRTQLEAHYRVTNIPLARWIKESGVQPKAGNYRYGPKPVAIPAADVSLAGRAAQYLRRYFSPVYRADVLPDADRNRLPNRGKGMFVVSSKGALPASEVIALAERKGFDPREWASLTIPQVHQSKEHPHVGR